MELLLTELVDAGHYDSLENAWAAVLGRTPFDSAGDPLDLGQAVAFPSSEHAGFVNVASVSTAAR